MNVAPITRLRGTVHTSTVRNVPALAAAPAERDPETGRIIKDAVEARDAYDVVDVTVHTTDGGYALVVLRGDHLRDSLGGEIPAKGSEVDWPIRNFVAWVGRAGRRFPTVGYSVAGDLLAAEKSTGRRSASVAAVG